MHGEVEVSFDVVGIHNVDDSLGFLLHDKLTRNNLLVGVRRQRIYSRKVGYQSIGMAFYHAVFAVDGDTREVSHMLVSASQMVEKRGFAAVLLTSECKGQNSAFRQRIFMFFVVINTFLTKSRVSVMIWQRCDIQFVDVESVIFRLFGRNMWFHLDKFGVGFAERERVAVHCHLHRVAHRGVFHDFDNSVGNHSHVEEMLAA